MHPPHIATSPASGPQVYILLATYNGAAYVEEQVKSIQNQSITDWRMLVRDDGSTDRTPEMLARLAQRDQRIEIVDSRPARNLGALRSFGLLMERARAAGAHYACFCDQDDVWHQQKIDWEISAARELERRHGERHPVLVYTDLEVVDSNLRTIKGSFYEYQGIRRGSEEPPFTTLLAQNHVVGCTTMMNRALLDLASPLPDEAYLHDWWVALCARACGSLRFLPIATVKYRQHQGNQVGAGGLRRFMHIGAWGGAVRKMNRIFLHSIAQAEPLRMRLQEWGSGPTPNFSESAQVIDCIFSWSRLHEINLWKRLVIAWRTRLRSQNFTLTLLLYLQLITLPFIKHL